MDTYCVGGQSHKMFGDSSFLWRTRREETWGRWCDEEESDHKHILNVSTQWSCTPSIWKHYGWIFSEQMLELLVSNYWFVCAVRLSLIQSVSISGCRQISVIQWAFREQGTNSLTSLAVWRNQSLADSALVMVSWVVNVWEKVKQQQSESSRCSQWTGVNTYVCVCVCAWSPWRRRWRVWSLRWAWRGSWPCESRRCWRRTKRLVHQLSTASEPPSPSEGPERTTTTQLQFSLLKLSCCLITRLVLRSLFQNCFKPVFIEDELVIFFGVLRPPLIFIYSV